MLFLGQTEIAKKPRGPAAARVKEPWHAIAIVAGPRACTEAAKLGGQRFLSDEAPRLPLPMCLSHWRCQCTYKHFTDRRAAAPRRELERTGLPGPRIGVERRTKAERRIDPPSTAPQGCKARWAARNHRTPSGRGDSFFL